MKNIFSVTLPAILLITGVLVFNGCAVNHNMVKTEEFSHYQKTRKIANLVIDTRSTELYEQSHYPGAVHVSRADPEFKQKLKEQAKSHGFTDIWILFVYEQDSNSTVELQKDMMQLYKRHWPLRGPTAVFYLKGGYTEWEMLRSK